MLYIPNLVINLQRNEMVVEQINGKLKVGAAEVRSIFCY